MKELVSFHGTLRGAGREARCTVLATKMTLPGTGETHYLDYAIRNAPGDLPNGRYELEVNGLKSEVVCRGGFWTAGEAG